MGNSPSRAAAAFLLCVVMVSGCASTAAPPPQVAPAKVTPAQVERKHNAPVMLDADARALAAADYGRYCSLCHGVNREGYINDHAPSLRSKSLLSTGYPMAIYNTIAYGRPGTPMGGYMDEVGGPLEQKAISRLISWLKQVENVEPREAGPAHLAGDAKRGAPLYAEHCASCHGTEGEGGTGTRLANPAMLALTPDGFLFDTISTGRDGTPMKSWSDTFDAGQIDDLVAFLRSRATYWRSTSKPIEPPTIDDLILNPHGESPKFPIKGDHYIVASELNRIINEKRRFVLLDTRVPSVWQVSHVPGAAPVPYYSNRDALVDALPNDGTWIIAYCECPRAAADSLYAKLKTAKFANAAVLWEGFGGWVVQGYPVAGGIAATPKAVKK